MSFRTTRGKGAIAFSYRKEEGQSRGGAIPARDHPKGRKKVVLMFYAPQKKREESYPTRRKKLFAAI